MQTRDERTKMRVTLTQEPLNNPHWCAVFAPEPRRIVNLDEAAAATGFVAAALCIESASAQYRISVLRFEGVWVKSTENRKHCWKVEKLQVDQNQEKNVENQRGVWVVQTLLGRP
jgi:hypothetical protein